MTICRCPIKPGMSYDDLIEIVRHTMCTKGEGLTKIGHMCPTLTKALDKADAGRDRRARAAQKLKSQGFTDDQIKDMPVRTRRRGGTVQETAPLLSFDDV